MQPARVAESLLRQHLFVRRADDFADVVKRVVFTKCAFVGIVTVIEEDAEVVEREESFDVCGWDYCS